MHEEQISVSDEEASDSEIVLVDRSPSPVNERYSSGALLDIQDTQAKFVTEEMKIDEQLKALGLFEEGMSMEQKEELLTVLEVSRETAQQEETRRKEAKEWEQQVYFSQGNKIEFHPCEQSPESSSHDVELCCLNSANKSESSTAIDKIKKGNTVPSKNSETLVTKPSRKTFEVLDIEDPETGESRAAATHQNPTFSTGIFYSRKSESCSRSSVHSDFEKARSERDQRGVHRLSRSAYHPSSSSNSKVAVAHPMIRESTVSGPPASYEDEDMSDEDGDAGKMHYELEKNMTSWRPCTSPVAPALKCERVNARPSLEFGNVPYFCKEDSNPKDYGKVILKSFNDYHMHLKKIQGSSSNYIPWGKPVRVGRHHLDTLDVQELQYETRSSMRVTRARTVPSNLKHSENEDEVYAEEENEDFDDGGHSALPDVNQVSEVECNTIIRTVKSAFHPTAIFSRETHADGYASKRIIPYEHHSTQSNDQDDEPTYAPITENDKVKLGTGRRRRRRALHEMNRVESCEDSSSRLALWSPFGPSVDASNDDNCCSKKYSNPSLETTDSSSKRDKESLSSEYVLSSTTNLKSDGFFIEDKVSDSDLFVRKDGQRTYASKQSQSSLVLSSETNDGIQAGNSQGSSGSKGGPEQTLHHRSLDDKMLVDTSSNVDEIEQRGISRKRKCEVRLKKLSASEIKNLCSGKRLKE